MHEGLTDGQVPVVMSHPDAAQAREFGEEFPPF
jgi:hypothetical protein